MDANTSFDDEFLTLKALLYSRAYVYELLHKAFGGEPSKELFSVLVDDATINMLEELGNDNDVIEKMIVYCKKLSEKIDNPEFSDKVKDEFCIFFESPANPPALPWESVYVGDPVMIFQPSTLEVREAYKAQGLQVKRFMRVPDDHISIMCAFTAELGKQLIGAFGEGDSEKSKELIAAQYKFIEEHMRNWVPQYAVNARKVEMAYLYPQLAQVADALTLIDETLLGEILGWLDEQDKDTFAEQAKRIDCAALNGAEEAMNGLWNLELRGLEDNQIINL